MTLAEVIEQSDKELQALRKLRAEAWQAAGRDDGRFLRMVMLGEEHAKEQVQHDNP